MLSSKAKRELKIDQRQILIDSIEIGISSPQQICLWGSRQLPNGKKVGLVKNSKTVNYKRFTPFRDGLFCERIFGPATSLVCACGKKQPHSKITFCEKCEVEYIDQRSRRYRLGYISLLSPVTHIWYLKGRPSYLSLFLGKRKKTTIALAYCNAYLIEHSYSKKDNEEHIWPFMAFQENPEKLLQNNLYRYKSLYNFSNSKESEMLHTSPDKCKSIDRGRVRTRAFDKDSPSPTFAKAKLQFALARNICEGRNTFEKKDACLSTSYGKKHYLRQHALPFLPTFVSHFYLRDALLHFIYSSADYTDIPLMEYCHTKRLEPLQDVHKLMARQSVNQFKNDLLCVRSLSYFSSHSQNGNLRIGLAKVQKRLFSKSFSSGRNRSFKKHFKTNKKKAGSSDSFVFCPNPESSFHQKLKPYKVSKECPSHSQRSIKNISRRSFRTFSKPTIKNRIKSEIKATNCCKAPLCTKFCKSFWHCRAFRHIRQSLYKTSLCTPLQKEKSPLYAEHAKSTTLKRFNNINVLSSNVDLFNRSTPLQIFNSNESKKKKRQTAYQKAKKEIFQSRITNLLQNIQFILAYKPRSRMHLRCKESFSKPELYRARSKFLPVEASGFATKLEQELRSKAFRKAQLSTSMYVKRTNLGGKAWCQSHLPLRTFTKLRFVRPKPQRAKFCFSKTFGPLQSFALYAPTSKTFVPRVCKTYVDRSILDASPLKKKYRCNKKSFSFSKKKVFHYTHITSFLYPFLLSQKMLKRLTKLDAYLRQRKKYSLDLLYSWSTGVRLNKKNLKNLVKAEFEQKTKKQSDLSNTRDLEQININEDKNGASLSHLELTTIREILSYTGGGALQQLLQQFDQHDLCKFLVAEKQILRVLYQKHNAHIATKENTKHAMRIGDLENPSKAPRTKQSFEKGNLPDSRTCVLLPAKPSSWHVRAKWQSLYKASICTPPQTSLSNALWRTLGTFVPSGEAFTKLRFVRPKPQRAKFCFSKTFEQTKLRFLKSKQRRLFLARSCQVAKPFLSRYSRMHLSELLLTKPPALSPKGFAWWLRHLAKPSGHYKASLCTPLWAFTKLRFVRPLYRHGPLSRESFSKPELCGARAKFCFSKTWLQSHRPVMYTRANPTGKQNSTLCRASKEIFSNSNSWRQSYKSPRVSRLSYRSNLDCLNLQLNLNRNLSSTALLAFSAPFYDGKESENKDVTNLQPHQTLSKGVHLKRIKQAKRSDLQKKEIIRISRRIYKVSRRLKVVQLLTLNHRRPEWMILSHLPVLPPDLRPILQMSEKVIVASDLNIMYQRVIYRNNRHLRVRFIDFHLVTAIQRLVQDAVDRLMENGKGGSKPYYTQGGRPLKSLSDILKGKKGRFRLNLLGKRVDFSGRSVIVVSPSLKIHECGLPRDIALELYHYFLLRQLIVKKHCASIVTAKKMIKAKSSLMWDILREIMYHHPVLLNRAPTLHRLGIQAFQPKLVLGNAIWLHPLVCSGFNADFDGDQMGVHLPLSFAARAESWDLLWSRNNLLSPATGQPMLVPSQDMVLGFYYMTAKATSSSKVNVHQCKQLMDFNAPFHKAPLCEEHAPIKGFATRHERANKKAFCTKGAFAMASFQNKNHFFLDTGSILTDLQNGALKLHTPVWLHWSGKVEDENSSQGPLELRVHSFGLQRYVYEKHISSNFFRKNKTTDFYQYKAPAGAKYEPSLYQATNNQNEIRPSMKKKCKVNFAVAWPTSGHREAEIHYLRFVQAKGLPHSKNRDTRMRTNPFAVLAKFPERIGFDFLEGFARFTYTGVESEAFERLSHQEKLLRERGFAKAKPSSIEHGLRTSKTKLSKGFATKKNSVCTEGAFESKVYAHQLTTVKGGLIPFAEAAFLYFICAEPKTYYVRTTAGRVLMNTLMKS